MLPNPQTHYSSSKFIVSIVGLLKIVALVMFLASSVVFLTTPVCGGTPLWFGKLYPISAAVSGILVALLYAIFATGIAKRCYPMWALIDLAFNMLDFTAMLVVSIVTISQCSSTTTSLQMVPAPMGIIGAVLLAISSVVWFIQTRTSNDLSLQHEAPTQEPHLYRKSVMV